MKNPNSTKGQPTEKQMLSASNLGRKLLKYKVKFYICDVKLAAGGCYGQRLYMGVNYV